MVETLSEIESGVFSFRARSATSPRNAQDVSIAFLQLSGEIFPFALDGRCVIERTFDLIETGSDIIRRFESAGNRSLKFGDLLLKFAERLSVGEDHRVRAFDDHFEFLRPDERSRLAVHSLRNLHLIGARHDQRAATFGTEQLV